MGRQSSVFSRKKKLEAGREKPEGKLPLEAVGSRQVSVGSLHGKEEVESSKALMQVLSNKRISKSSNNYIAIEPA